MRRDPVLVVLVAVFVLVCAAWGARTVVHQDSVPLQLALAHQDLRLHQPQPPGYVLTLWLAEVVQAFTSHPVLSLRVATLLLLAASAFFLDRLARLFGDRGPARLAVLLFLTCPLVLFHGMTTGTDAGEAAAGTSSAYFLARAWRAGRRDLAFPSYWIGLMGGLRPTTYAATLPLLVWMGTRLGLSRRSWAHAAVAILLGALCWLIPQANIAGGLDDYFPIVWRVAWPALQEGAAFGGPGALVHRVAVLASALCIGMGGARSVMLAARSTRRLRREPAAPPSATPLPRALLIAWILPPVLAALLLGIPSTGYALAVVPPLCLWLALAPPFGSWLGRPLLLGATVALDLAAFFFVTTPATRPAVTGAARAADRLLVNVDFFYDRTRVPEFAPLRDTLQDLGPLGPATLVVGAAATRPACIVAPARHVLQFDPLRPAPFLHYQDEHPTLVPEPYIVPQEISWLLLEGNPTQIVPAAAIVPGQADPIPRSAGVELAAGFHLLPLGDGAIDLWYVPASGDGSMRIHLVRGAPPTDPKVFERAGGDSRDDARVACHSRIASRSSHGQDHQRVSVSFPSTNRTRPLSSL